MAGSRGLGGGWGEVAGSVMSCGIRIVCGIATHGLVWVPDPQQEERVWSTSHHELVLHCQQMWASKIRVNPR